MRKLTLMLMASTIMFGGIQTFAQEEVQSSVQAVPTISIEALFKPKAQTSNKKLDYTFFDTMLEASVVSLGPSDRRRKARPPVMTATKIVSGHVSAYRLEGARISFSFLTDDYLEAAILYRQDLERIGSELDLTSLSRQEQLAFWFNLHNVAIIEQIMKQYPDKRPHELKIDGVVLDDAKFITIKGMPLSLRDIREKIVYTHWKDPRVVYGFFRGNIGSPAIQSYAYTGENIETLLKLQAYEFVNALRGFNMTDDHRRVSQIYAEARPYLFKNWDKDLTAHLLIHAREDVAEEIRSGKPIIIDKYDYKIADLLGGERPRAGLFRLENGAGYPLDSRIPFEAQRLIGEVQIKFETLRRQGNLRRGYVIIEDVDTSENNSSTSEGTE